MKDELITIPAVVYQNAMNSKDKIIKALISAVVILCVLFVGYIAIDRYLDTQVDTTSDFSVSQDANGNGKNTYTNVGYAE